MIIKVKLAYLQNASRPSISKRIKRLLFHPKQVPGFTAATCRTIRHAIQRLTWVSSQTAALLLQLQVSAGSAALPTNNFFN